MITVRGYTEQDLPEIIKIWNEVVEEGIAFPQEDVLDLRSGAEFFASQSYTGVAEEDGRIYGLYILHPNSESRGRHIGEKLVLDCLKKGKELGFRVLQFNAVVESNVHARHLYERLGFTQLGTIPGGFRMKDGHYENICPYYKEL